MDIQQLKYYRELCRVKNFTEAGFACSLSQSALSKQIRRLEKELNVTLIRRNTRKFELTEEGEIFLEYAGQALERYGKMLEDIHSKKEIHIGSMTVLSRIISQKCLPHSMSSTPISIWSWTSILPTRSSHI